LGSKRGSTAKAIELAKEYLLHHPSASTEEVAKNTGISPRSVTSARKVLVGLGMLGRSPFDHRSKPGSRPEMGDDSTPNGPNEAALPAEPGSDLPNFDRHIAGISDEPLTIEEMKARYSRIARWAGVNKEFNLEIAAIGALARLEQQTGDRNRLGPPPPLTREAKVKRESAIIEACGPSITAESVIVAFDRAQIDRFLDELGRYMAKNSERFRYVEHDPLYPTPEGGGTASEAGLQPSAPGEGTPLQPETAGDPVGTGTGESEARA